MTTASYYPWVVLLKYPIKFRSGKWTALFCARLAVGISTAISPVAFPELKTQPQRPRQLKKKPNFSRLSTSWGRTCSKQSCHASDKVPIHKLSHLEHRDNLLAVEYRQ